MKSRFLCIISIIISLSVLVKAQESDENSFSKVSPPENIKQEIVRRILVFKFKPAKKQKIINLAKKDINPSWLPEIQNIKFNLLSNEEIEDINTDIYFFTKIEKKGKVFSIGFAVGDPNCNYVGDEWNFRITNNKLRLWNLEGRGVGGGCGGGEFKTPGELNTYPNELNGYKFFDRGKLKGIKITISTKEDVKKIFGSYCNGGCDYNNKWKIDFNYFGEISRQLTVNEKKVSYVPKKEFVGKIYSITFTPKQNISFSKKVFPVAFNLNYSFSVGDSFDDKGRLSAAGNFFKTYYDRYGLKYNVYQSGYAVGDAKKEDRNEGDLFFIEYSIPEKIEETTFDKEQ